MNKSIPYSKKWILALLLGFGLMMAGCHPLSASLRGEVNSDLTFQEVLKQPSAHIGEKIILGGVIVKTTNLENVTEIEVVQKDLDTFGYPSYTEKSAGRFIFRVQGFLDPVIYERGREVTGGGTLGSPRQGNIGEISYLFQIVEAEELKLWEKGYPPVYSPYYYSPYYGPIQNYRFRPRHYYW